MRLSVLAQVAAVLAHLVLIGGQFVLLGPLIGSLLGLPLMLVLYGLLRAHRYSAAAGSLLMLVYLGGWSMEAFGQTPTPPLIALMCAASVAAFVSDLLFVKWQAVEARAMRSAPAESSPDASR